MEFTLHSKCPQPQNKQRRFHHITIRFQTGIRPAQFELIVVDFFQDILRSTELFNPFTEKGGAEDKGGVENDLVDGLMHTVTTSFHLAPQCNFS